MSFCVLEMLTKHSQDPGPPGELEGPEPAASCIVKTPVPLPPANDNPSIILLLHLLLLLLGLPLHHQQP